MNDDVERARRWRLVLGRYAEGSLHSQQCLGPGDSGLETTLGYLYDREYEGRGQQLGADGGGGRTGGGGGADAAPPTAIDWLGEARRLFPAATFERMQVDALERYGLTELLADPEALTTIDASPRLATALMGIRGTVSPEIAEGIRTLMSRVVDDIARRLRGRFATALLGRRDRLRTTARRTSSNVDWQRTIRANLANYDPERGQLVVDEVVFNPRSRKRLEWDVVLLVDQSGSMAESVLYTAVCAAILAALPGISVRLYAFDVRVVDLSHLAEDPVELLMTAQLGGGTDIGGAVEYCEARITRPARTVVALISDFEEGGSVPRLLRAVTRMRESGVTLLGLAALAESGEPGYDRDVAARLAAAGMQVAAVTPDRFADWLAEVMQ